MNINLNNCKAEISK